MKRWLSRIGTFLLVMIWLLAMLFPFVAFWVAAKGQLQIGQSERRHLRIFLVQDDDNNGLGMDWTHGRWGQNTCSQTTVLYWLWEGQGRNTSYCQCYDPATGDHLPLTTSEAMCTQ